MIGENFKGINTDNDSKTGWEILENLEPQTPSAEKLREQVIDITKTPAGALAAEFPSGNYLYHGAENEKIAQIIESGYLGNAMAVSDKVGTNSGYEGISWSMDGIDALPGTDGHLAGFLAAPEFVLGNETKLVVPSRPAPYEMLQISDTMETGKFYEHRIQNEMFSDMGIISEKNSVKNNFAQVMTWLSEQQKPEPNPWIQPPMLFNFLQTDFATDDLKNLYEYDEKEQATKFSKELFQQSQIPVGAVWMQKAIDTGWLTRAGNGEYGDLDGWARKIQTSQYDKMDVKQMLQEMQNGDQDLAKLMLLLAGNAIKHYDRAVDQDLQKANPIKVPISEMYFITNRQDLDTWINKFVQSGQSPKGILLYDDTKITKSNFASENLGDHEELNYEFQHAVGQKSHFWDQDMDIDFDQLARGGRVGQVIKETAVQRGKVVKLIDGKLQVTKEPMI